MTLVIDNYDSFVYNLVQYLAVLDRKVVVRRNDEITLAGIRRMRPDRIVISPGPCTPKEAGLSVPLVREFAGAIPILGVCLGHQCAAAAFGGRIVPARRLMHGKTSWIRHDRRTIFRGLPNPFIATRYHSLAVDRKTLPEDLEITATAEDGEIMGIRHRTLAVEGVQFHPESVLTTVGKKLLRNFVRLSWKR